VAIPEQIEAPTLDDCLEVMTRAVFQAGISWALIDKKWPAFLKAFADFDVWKVAKFSKAKIERLSKDASIVRSPDKIAATVENAKALLALEEDYGELQIYFDAFPDYPGLVADLQSRFKYMGDLNCYYFLFRVKGPVPRFETWVRTISGDHPRMLEMVKLARSQGLSEGVAIKAKGKPRR
jgi:hypothetical protein